jgi:hypothetical protein
MDTVKKPARCLCCGSLQAVQDMFVACRDIGTACVVWRKGIVLSCVRVRRTVYTNGDVTSEWKVPLHHLSVNLCVAVH